VYWSRKFYERERAENKKFIEFTEKLKANPHGFRITASQSSSLRRFLKNDVLDKSTGEVLDGTKLAAMIDDEKLTEFNDLMGYYQIVTSELEMPDTEVIDKYHGLTRIEDQFREMKGTLETRPIYLQTPEHIKAHLIVCFIALTMIRVMQNKIKKCLPQTEKTELNWSYGMTGKKLVQILSDWKVDALPCEYYRMTHSNIDDLKLLFQAFEIPFETKLFSSGDLQKMKSYAKVY
jgi:transposase